MHQIVLDSVQCLNLYSVYYTRLNTQEHSFIICSTMNFCDNKYSTKEFCKSILLYNYLQTDLFIIYPFPYRKMISFQLCTTL